MLEFMPSDDEGLRRWCRHQVDLVPHVGAQIGMTPAEITVFVENSLALIAALEGLRPAKKRRDPKKAAARIKRTSLRRLVEDAKTKPNYCEEIGQMLRWVGRGFAVGAHGDQFEHVSSVYSDAA